MSKQIAYIPLNTVKRIQLYINKDGKKLSDIVKETGADYAMNGGLFEGNKAVCHLKADGYVYARDQYTYWGYSWEAGPDISMEVIPREAKNYISCVPLIRGRTPNPKPTYNKDVGGVRARTAIGIKDGNLCMYVSSDGSKDSKSPEGLRDELHALGWESAIMLDGGGSSQCNFIGNRIDASRIVHNLILVFLNKGEDKPLKPKTYTVCIDPGHGVDTVNGSPDGTYKEQEFTWNMYQRIKPLLEKQGINVVGTRKQDEKPSLTERALVSDTAKADLLVSLHTNATGGGGWNEANGLIVITSAPPISAPRNVIATKLLNSFRPAGVSIRGLGLAHDVTLTILAKPIAPAVLIEYGFHTNKGDVELLKTAAYRDKLAIATAKGVCDYFGIAYKEEPKLPIPTESWYAEAQRFVISKGISDGTRPMDTTTRAEVWEMLKNYNRGE